MMHVAQVLTIAGLGVFAARAAEPVATIGPVELCESQALVQTYFNPTEYTVTKEVKWVVESPAGFSRETTVLQIPPGRGVTVGYQQGRVLTDADLNEMPDTCARPTTVTAILAGGEELQASALRGYDKSHRLTRGSRVAFGTVLAQGGSRAVSEPFELGGAREAKVRLMAVGSAGGAYTVEILDAISGLVVAAKTVYLDPKAGAGSNASAEIAFHRDGAGPLVAVIRGSGAVASGSGPSVVAFAVQAAGGGEVAIEKITIVHEKIDRVE